MCQKGESSKTISEKKETSNPNPWFLSKIVIWCQTMDVGFLFEIRPVLFV
ncbi:hypothetical protein LEP1GSC046_1285 [Leptospira kirschneri serovar Bim str. 1051]|nr:hypothetical protein LEP1GSC042_3744 [Leptospira kirschneri serovar Bim str. PUO 1247]EMN06468.1 hypothetical protein LEP1GSC046_1285 [Leptospira kirschneri serovar Bim str. 1051]